MAARIDEAAIVMLPVQFHQRRGDLPQQGRAHRLVVDEGLGPAICPDAATQDQRLARLRLDLRPRQCFANQRRESGKLKRGGDVRLILARADERSFRPIAENQAESIQEDRLAGTRLARKHAQPRPEGEVQRLDQDDIADGQGGEHREPPA